MSMEYTYPPTSEVGRGDNQLYPLCVQGTFATDYPVSVYDCVQATMSRYPQPTSQNPISSSISFMPPVNHFPDANQHAIVAVENQQQLRPSITSLQKRLQNFALYCFCCQLNIEIYGSYLGQTRVQLMLRKTRTDATASKEFTFPSTVAIKEHLKQAILELAQPLLTTLTPCSSCHLKHYKKSCMCPFLPMTGH